MGRMEKQEMEMKWKLEMETGNWKQKWKCNLLAGCSPTKIQLLLRFIPRHPSSLPASSFDRLLCYSLASLASFPGLCHPQFPLGLCKSLLMFSAVFYLWCSTLSYSRFCINMPCTCPEINVWIRTLHQYFCIGKYWGVGGNGWEWGYCARSLGMKP